MIYGEGSTDRIFKRKGHLKRVAFLTSEFIGIKANVYRSYWYYDFNPISGTYFRNSCTRNLTLRSSVCSLPRGDNSQSALFHQPALFHQ